MNYVIRYMYLLAFSDNEGMTKIETLRHIATSFNKIYPNDIAYNTWNNISVFYDTYSTASLDSFKSVKK